MMNTQLIIGSVLAIGLLGPCAGIPTTPGEALSSGANLAGKGLEAHNRADAQCKQYFTNEVAWDEERALGGAVAIGLATKQSKGVFVDAEKKGYTDAELNALRIAGDANKVTLKQSDRNALNAYLAVVGRHLANYSPRSVIPWTFAVIDAAEPNAFSAPGGYVFVSTGLLKLIDNEAQLAGVLAHEIGHVSHRHAIHQYQTAKGDKCTLAVYGGAGIELGVEGLPSEARSAASFARAFSGGALDLNAQTGAFLAYMFDGLIDDLVSKGFSHDFEFEADKTALELMIFAGYDSKEFDVLLKKLPEGGGTFKNHPTAAERVAKLDALRSGEFSAFANGGVKGENASQLKWVKK